MLWRRRRNRPPDPEVGIEAFWRWWAGTGELSCRLALDAHDAAAVMDQLTAHVREIHPELVWELGTEQPGSYQLVVSAEGDRVLRLLTRRWLLAAPPPDGRWQLRDARPPVPDVERFTLRIENGRAIQLADAAAELEIAGGRLDVVIHHPTLAELPELEARRLVWQILLSALGEDRVELWVAAIEWGGAPPGDALTLAELAEAVDDFEREHVSDDGEPMMLMLEGDFGHGEMILVAQAPMHPLTAPQADTLVVVELPYDRDATVDGLPDEATDRALAEARADLWDDYEGDGVIVAAAVGNGECTLFTYVDGSTDAAERARALAERWPHGAGTLAIVEPDPGWAQAMELPWV